MSDKIVNPQSYAHPFEFIIRNVFDCDRFGAFGIADADYIRSNPLTAVTATCFYIYAKSGESKKKEIEDFLNEADYYFQFNFDTLLSFETKSKCINGSEYTLDYENGSKAIESLEEKFRNICK